MVELEIQRDGSLLITLEDREELEDVIARSNDDSTAEVLDMAGYLGNGWEDGTGEYALTDAPIIEYDGEAWFYPMYMRKDWRKELLKRGRVIFQRVTNESSKMPNGKAIREYESRSRQTKQRTIHIYEQLFPTLANN